MPRLHCPIPHFDLIARWYDRLISRPVVDPLPRLLAAEPGQVIVDVGGGTGRNTNGLAALGARVVVCDISHGMSAQAKVKNLAAVRGDARHLPFPTGCADRVLVVDSLHHFVDPTPEVAQPAAVAEIMRILRPGGYALVEEPDITRRGVALVVWMERLLLMRSRFLAPEAILRLFRAAGARPVVVEGDRFSFWCLLTRP